MLPTVAVIVLAAGLSRRFGAEDKLMATFQGRPMVDTVLEAAATAGPLIVVTRADSPLAMRPDAVINPDPERGMGRSLALGMAQASDMEAVFVTLGDMPLITADTYARLKAAWSPQHDILVPVYDGRDGHPVLFGRACFRALAALDGDKGARSLIEDGAFRVQRLALPGRSGLIDLDTPADLAIIETPRPRPRLSVAPKPD